MQGSTTPQEPKVVPPEVLQKLWEAHENKKAYDKAYMHNRRLVDRDEINRRKRELYRKKKEARLEKKVSESVSTTR
jgi:predicted outer membrane protein